MTFIGTQGPFYDKIGSLYVTDRGTGWIYDPARTYCFHCGEQEVIGDEDIFCWACQNPIPLSWEQQHEDALFLTRGPLQEATR